MGSKSSNARGSESGQPTALSSMQQAYLDSAGIPFPSFQGVGLGFRIQGLGTFQAPTLEQQAAQQCIKFLHDSHCHHHVHHRR